jgi:hypothetical protein
MARTRSRLARAGAAAAACLLLLPAGAAAQDEGAELTLALRLATRGHTSKLLDQLQYNCNLFFSVNQVPQGGSDGTWASFTRPALGTADFAAGTGEIRAQRGEWQVEALPPSNARVRFAELGIAMRGRRVFLTARLTRGRPLISGSRRVRLAEVLGAKLEQGPLIDRRNRRVPSTFSTAITGRLSMLSGMSRALERTRCKDLRRNRLSRRLRPGFVLGRFIAELRPGRATGLAGTAELRATGLDPVTARPGAGSTLNAAGAITAPIAAGFPVPLVCLRGDHCVPSGGTFALGGGLELVNGDRAIAVGNLVIATTGTPPDALRQTITGTLGGAPVTVAEGPASGSGSTLPLAMTADFNQRAGAALGTELAGFLAVEPAFASTGP